MKKIKPSKLKRKQDRSNRRLVVVPYVKAISERVAWVMRKHQVPVAMKPVKTLRKVLVHPKDKQQKDEITDCIYKIPCGSYDKCYIGETGKNLA